MQSLVMDKTNSTPYINFDVDTAILQIKGESYPENVAKFYTPVMNWIQEYLKIETKEITVEFEIVYFNSSTSKIFITIFDVLEQEFMNGKKIRVKWLCDEENETAIECGEEFKEELSALPFEIELL